MWHNDYGLPFVYSIDEASHFTSRAVEMFWQDLDPGYYQNPAAYTYLVYGTLRVLYGPLGFLFDLPYGNVTEQFDKDPTEIWVVARTLAAVLCMAGVAATYAAARRLWGVREGLVAAAVLAFAFLPVAYSRVAVTDVGALIGVALALLWSVRAAEEGRTRGFVLAGGAAGLAIAFKYTAGLVLLPLAIAATRGCGPTACGRWPGWRPAAQPPRVVFALLNPYLFGSFGDWWTDLRDQADVAANDASRGSSRAASPTTWTASPGARLGRHRGGAWPGRCWCCDDAGARAGAGGAAAGAVRLPGAAVALLRALAAARLPGAGDAGRGGSGAGAELVRGAGRWPPRRRSRWR